MLMTPPLGAAAGQPKAHTAPGNPRRQRTALARREAVARADKGTQQKEGYLMCVDTAPVPRVRAWWKRLADPLNRSIPTDQACAPVYDADGATLPASGAPGVYADLVRPLRDTQRAAMRAEVDVLLAGGGLPVTARVARAVANGDRALDATSTEAALRAVVVLPPGGRAIYPFDDSRALKMTGTAPPGTGAQGGAAPGFVAAAGGDVLGVIA